VEGVVRRALQDPDTRARAIATAAAARAARAAATTTYRNGTTLGPDTPPGVGWRLQIPGVTPRYFATREAAIEYAERRGPTLVAERDRMKAARMAGKGGLRPSRKPERRRGVPLPTPRRRSGPLSPQNEERP
jgi:hypothetical protein